MRAPGVVGACIAVAAERPAEVRHRKRGDARIYSSGNRVVVEGRECGRELVEKSALTVQEIAVIVETAEAHEEELPRDAEDGPRLDQTGDLLQLIRDAGIEQRSADRE